MKMDWQEILIEFSGSGVTAKQFCKERSINKATFYYWKKKLSANKEHLKGFLGIDVSAPSK
ncbi:MAG: nitrate/TMAO reductase-like tetraheme cytochrome c subunit, partial [Arcticibacterium sp.]